MKSMKRNGMILAMSLLILLFCTTGVFAATTESEDIGVQYRGHVQNKGDMPQPVGTMVKGPDALGTRGESLRVEGFWIELTGDVPEGAAIKYQVHVQNEGWLDPVSDGKFAGTAGKSQRVESIRISLENLPGYDVYYRGHVQNIGDVPQVNGDWGWKKNGEELGTTGSSLRLEELQIKVVKQSDVTYDKAGTYGPKTGEEVVHTNVVINTPDVTLQNMHITGDLIIGEGVGEGDVTLNNITVDGDTFIRGGGKNSIHINGGDYNKITVQQTSSGQVRIVATDANGLEVVISEDAGGEDIILEGAFENVQVDAPDVKISTQGDTSIKQMNMGESAKGSEVTLGSETKVENLVLDAEVDVKGQGTVEKAKVNSDGVTFEKAPEQQDVAPEVEKPPVVTPPEEKPPVTPPVTPNPGPGGGVGVAVTSVTVDKETMQLNAGGATESITATINPSNASSKNVTWTTSNQDIATVNNGVVTPVAAGTATITVTSSADSSKKATTVVTVKAAISATPIAANAPIPSTVISLTGDTFSQGADNIDNWTINSETTGLTVSSIVLHGTAGTATSATVNFTGTAAVGTFEMTPKATALTSNISGNKASITVTDQPLVKSTTPTTDTAVVAKTAQTQASVNFTLTSTHLAGVWTVYTNAACTTEATGVTASLSWNTLALTHATDLPAVTYYVVYNDGTRTDSDALALTVSAYSEEPTAVSAVTAPSLIASNGDLQINFDEPSDLTGISMIRMTVSCDDGQTWATAATALVADDPYFSSDSLSLSLTRISYRLEGMTTINKIKVISVAETGYLDGTFEMPCSLTINTAADALPIVATYNNGTVQATMSAAKQDGETYFYQMKRANGTLITESMMGEPNWISSTTAEFRSTFTPYPADGSIQLVKGSGATVIDNSTGSVNVTPLQAGGVTFTDITPTQSTTPTADTTTVAKTTQTQASVGFTLTSSHTGGTWKVFSNADCTTAATGVSAALSGNTLTLAHATDLPAATYYVVYNDGTHTDSEALALTVGAHEENRVDVVKNVRFEASNGTSSIYFDQPTEKTGIQNYQIMFSSDNGLNWDYTAQLSVANEGTISLDMSALAINLNETKAFNKVKVISNVSENSDYQQNETSFAIDFTITKEGSELAIAVARNESNDVEITLPENALDDETYAIRIFGASGVGASSTITFKGSYITDNVITMSHATQPISGLSEGAVFKVCKINKCTTTGLSVTPMQATGVPINSTPPTLSSEKAITATTVGTLTGGNITGVPGGTKVSVLKAGLTVSDSATVEIITGTGGTAVADQANADVTAEMKIQVTAEDNSKAEYSIAMAPTLDAPTDFRAVAGDESIELHWSTVANAESYKVYQSTTSGSGYSEVVNLQSSSSYQVLNLTPGQTYYFVVKAVATGYNDSPNSSEVSAIANVTPSSLEISGNQLIISNESTDLATQSTGTLSSIVTPPMNELNTEGMEGSIRINPEIPLRNSPDQGTLDASMLPTITSSQLSDVQDFYTYNYTTATYDTTTAHCAFIGTNVEVWIEDNASPVQLTDIEATTIGQEFDNNIYGLVTTNFYDASDVDHNGKITILCYDIKDGYTSSGSYIGGYYDPNNQYTGATSNQMDMIFVDTYPMIGTSKNLSNSYSTMAHELQHLVNYNCNQNQGGQMATWLNEAMSQAAEQMYNGVQAARIAYFNNSTVIADGRSVIDWQQADSLPNYSLSYLFGQYLRTQAEQKLDTGVKTDIFKDILVDPGDETTALTNAIHSNIDTNLSLSKVLTNFRVATALKATTGVYGFGKDAVMFFMVSPKVSTLTSADLKGGGAIIKDISAGPFTVPAVHGNNVTYTGVY